MPSRLRREGTEVVKVHGSPEWKERVREYADHTGLTMSHFMSAFAAAGVRLLDAAGCDLRDLDQEQLDALVDAVAAKLQESR